MKAVREGSIILLFERHKFLVYVVMCEALQILTGNSSDPKTPSMRRGG